MEIEKRNLLIGTLIALILAALLSLIPLWQLVFIAGFLGGLINKKVLYGALSGALGVGSFWILYIIDGIFFKGLYNLFDIFGRLLIGSGFGWLILLLIILLGILFGFLGGTLGSSGRNLFMQYYNKRT
ncbi:MAG: hypothetical protein EU541_03700 [Promethearchaeota archaeon]|nr:MAG: hypothetical protein EU541_03700 [Candidatus Lokiarchaeota archaeon]